MMFGTPNRTIGYVIVGAGVSGMTLQRISCESRSLV